MKNITRQWKNKGKFFDDEFLQDIRLLIAFAATAKNIEICGWDGTGEPTITNRLISLNGANKDNLDGQTFTLESDYKKSPVCYCQTNGKPYDNVVCAILLKALEQDYIYDLYPSRENSNNGEDFLRDFEEYKNKRMSMLNQIDNSKTEGTTTAEKVTEETYTTTEKEIPKTEPETALIQDLGFFEQLLIEYKKSDDLEGNIKSLLIAMYTENEGSFFGELYNLNKLYLDSSLAENSVQSQIPLTHIDLMELLTNYPDEILTRITKSEDPALISTSEYVVLNTDGTFSASNESEYIRIAKSNLFTIFADYR